jgi:adenylate cyclase
MHRRLAAVLTADVIGYGRLVSEDQARTLDRVRKLRKELIEPAVGAHEGRIVKPAGDGVLAEFVSAVEAVRCAVEIQRALDVPNGAFGAGPPLQLRIGVHLGGVLAEGGGLRGDGVKVATRLEGLAKPGGICITRTVLGQIKGQVDVAFEDLGEIEVEDIPQPVHVFQVLLDPNAAKRPAGVAGGRPWHRQVPALALGLAMFAFLVSASLWLITAYSLPPEPVAFPLPDRT